jgi:hypothetical protein
MNTRTIITLGLAFVVFASTSAAAEPLPSPLKLPPGLEETLALHKPASYAGDALRAVNCPDDRYNPYGTCGNLLFGGLVMGFSHLSGNVHIRFYTPSANVAHFEVRHPGGLKGDGSVLSSPTGYRIPTKLNVVVDATDKVCEGDLNLETGEVTNLNYTVAFVNSTLYMLGKVNPKLEAPAIRFPGTYGSAWARFEQRSDGLLDFTFYGSTFLPLGNDIKGDPVWLPMPPCDSQLNCAKVPAAGTSLHPNLRLSTKSLEDSACGSNCAEIPEDKILEFTTSGYSTSFGDDFHLNIPELGGTGYGRSHLVGRNLIQFGTRFGDSIPFAISSVPPSALLAEPPASPISFDGLSLGLLGHNEFLPFPRQTYFLQDVAFADDPFDLQIGAVDLKTGQVIGGLLYRGFIAQNLLIVLLQQNEGRIAPSSFNFRGPARFDKGANGQLVFRFQSTVQLDFTDYRFPSPDFVKAHSWVAGEGSFLEPFLNIQSMSPTDVPRAVKSGNGSAVSSTNDAFTYSYSVPCDPGGKSASFEYTNGHPTNGGTFRMHSLASVQCTNSPSSQLAPGDYDTVTFTAYGSWSGDKSNGLHLATVQVSTSSTTPYVSIIVDGGTVSNVNTKPPIRPIP